MTEKKVPTLSGSDLLDGVERVFRRYVIFPTDDHYVAMALWVMATHALPLEVFDFAPRLALVSPEKRCGKSRTMDVAKPLCHKGFKTINASTAVLFRRNDKEGPMTIFFDEADTVFGKASRNDSAKEDLRGFYNGGFEPDATLDRCINGGANYVSFKSFAMVMLASKGIDLPDTIMDRAIVFRIRRRMVGEKVEPFRQRLIPGLSKSGEKLGVWCTANADALEAADPESDLIDREADVWAPLLAVADVAAGRWPKRAREAATALTRNEKSYGEESRTLELLRDIRRVFPEGDFIPTKLLVDALNDDRPEIEGAWGSTKFGNSSEAGLTGYWLSKFLKPYGLQSKQKKVESSKRVDGKSVSNLKGYYRSELMEAWSRYVTVDDDA